MAPSLAKDTAQRHLGAEGRGSVLRERKNERLFLPPTVRPHHRQESSGTPDEGRLEETAQGGGEQRSKHRRYEKYESHTRVFSVWMNFFFFFFTHSQTGVSMWLHVRK